MGVGMKKRIQKILQTHKGKEHPITSAKIAEMLGIKEDDTHAKTRAIIRECAEEYYLPLLSSNRGYYLAQSENELNQYIKNLDSRIAGIKERKRIIKNNFERHGK